MTTNVKQKIHKYKNDPTDECELEDLNLNTLQECLDHYKDTMDAEPLESVIYEVENKIANAIRNLNSVITGCRLAQFDATADALCDIRNSLKL
jgi:hypothetical protein